MALRSVLPLDASITAVGARWRVLLMSTPDLHWAALRAALEAMPEVAIVGEARSAAAACAQAAAAAPDLIIAAATLDGGPVASRLTTLRDFAPGSALIVIAESFAPQELTDLAAFGVAGYLRWQDLDGETLQHCLAAVGRGQLLVGSRDLAPAVTAAQVRGAPASAPAIDARGRVVLDGLRRGLTKPQIAARTGLALRTVERTVAELQARLDAPSLFVLGVKAAQLGLLPDDDDPTVDHLTEDRSEAGGGLRLAIRVRVHATAAGTAANGPCGGEADD